MGSEMDAEDGYSKKTWSLISSKAKVLMSGTNSKNQGWYITDPVIDQCERKELCCIFIVV